MATEINQPAGYAPDSYESGRTGWTGWIAFAGVMMIIGGGLNALYGLVAVSISLIANFFFIPAYPLWTPPSSSRSTYSSSGLSLPMAGRCARPDPGSHSSS